MTRAGERAVISGIGQTRYTRWGGITDRSEFHLALDAVMAAAADAGLPISEIDGFTTFGGDRTEPAMLQRALGIPRLRFSATVHGGGGGGSCGAVALAAAAVESGQAECVIAFRSLCQGQSGRFGLYDPYGLDVSFAHPFGAFAPVQHLALVVRRHMHEYGTTPEHLGRFAVACRQHAHRNPNAVMGGRPLSLESYLEGRMISDPLRLYDCCLENDGACAVLVTSRARGRDLATRPVDILAAAHGGGAGWGSGPLGSHNQPLADYPSGGAREVARDLYGRAGVGPGDIAVAQIYDNFSGMALMSLEDFGFCGVGESGPFVASGAVDWPNGALPVNTHGGSLSEAYIHGLNHVIEGVRQVRGTSTAQVPDAELCLVSGGPGPSPTSGLILARI